MSAFNKNHCALCPELMDILAARMENDPFYQEHKGKSFENRPQYLQKLKSSLRVKDSERILTFVEDSMIFHGSTGMIVTENGIYYKGVMEMAKFTSWYELMCSPLNILITNETPISIRVKSGFGHKPFSPAIGGNGGNDCADFWIRIKQAIADYYQLAA